MIKKKSDKKLSKYFLSGIILSIISILLIFCFFFGMNLLENSPIAYNYQGMIIFIIIGILCLLSALTGVALFIVGLIKHSKKKTIGIIGIIIGLLVFLSMLPYVNLLIRMYVLFISK